MNPSEIENKPFEQLSWKQKRLFVEALSVPFAMVTLPLGRKKMGFRLLRPFWTLGMPFSMLISLNLVPVSFAGPVPGAVVLYAVILAAAGFIQRWFRWQEICSGVRWHSFSPGHSYLEWLRFPAFFQCNRRISRFVEPIALLLVGTLLMLTVSKLLGAWIIGSAIGVKIYEHVLWEKSLDHQLNQLDGLCVAEVDAETMRFYQNSPHVKGARKVRRVALR